MKKCSICKLEKKFSEYGKHTCRKDGLRGTCKLCENSIGKTRYLKNLDTNREKAREKANIFRLANPEIIKERSKKTYLRNKEKIKKQVKLYQSKNKEKVKQWRDNYTNSEFGKKKIKECAKKYFLENKEKINARRRKNRNKEKCNEYNKALRLKLSDYYKQKDKERYSKNKEKNREKNRKYYKENKIKKQQYAKKWRENNKDKYLATAARCKQRAKQKNELFNVEHSMSQGIRYSLKNIGGKQNKKWEDIVGYTLKQLIAHLESKFTKGMTWKNFGRDGWNIDHIIPRSLFKYNSINHPAFRACWALSNLQPLWETTSIAISYGENPDYVGNIDKGNRIKITKEIEDFLKTVNN